LPARFASRNSKGNGKTPKTPTSKELAPHFVPILMRLSAGITRMFETAAH
jgi:hypothetical protein